MLFRKSKDKLESKGNFSSKIEEYYSKISDGRVPSDLLSEIVIKVTDRLYDDYKRFWKQYPKSRKRYSQLRLDDIEQPFVHHLITNYLQEEASTEYRTFSKILLQMDDDGFSKYEKGKDEYFMK